jgi:hypothetical protein
MKSYINVTKDLISGKFGSLMVKPGLGPKFDGPK